MTSFRVLDMTRDQREQETADAQEPMATRYRVVTYSGTDEFWANHPDQLAARGYSVTGTFARRACRKPSTPEKIVSEQRVAMPAHPLRRGR